MPTIQQAIGLLSSSFNNLGLDIGRTAGLGKLSSDNTVDYIAHAGQLQCKKPTTARCYGFLKNLELALEHGHGLSVIALYGYC